MPWHEWYILEDSTSTSLHAVADLESFVGGGGGGGGGEHFLAGRWSLSKRRNSGSCSRSVVIHVVSRLCLVTIST